MNKVLYIGGFCMPDGNAAAQRVLGIAKALREIYFDVRFVGLTRSCNKEEGSVDGFSYVNYPYPMGFGSWLKYLAGKDKSIAEIEKWKPDVVILYNHPALAIERIARYCHKHGIKVVADITEWYGPEGNPLYKFIKGFDTNRRMRRSHLQLDGLICISSYLAEFYRTKGMEVVEIPPLVDITQDKWHQPIEISEDELRLVYAGSPGSSKDRLDLILQAMDRVVPTLDRKVRFDIIGITKEQYMTTWGDTTEREYVIFNGRKSHREVIKKLLEADFQIFLRPDTLTNRAGFPTKFVETVTSRTIPVTNLSSNLADYIQDNVNGIVVQSLEDDSIIEAVIKVLSLSNKEIQFIKSQQNSAIFDFHRYLEKFKDFCRRL